MAAHVDQITACRVVLDRILLLIHQTFGLLHLVKRLNWLVHLFGFFGDVCDSLWNLGQILNCWYLLFGLLVFDRAQSLALSQRALATLSKIRALCMWSLRLSGRVTWRLRLQDQIDTTILRVLDLVLRSVLSFLRDARTSCSCSLKARLGRNSTCTGSWTNPCCA